jgi:hypothetical protein
MFPPCADQDAKLRLENCSTNQDANLHLETLAPSSGGSSSAPPDLPTPSTGVALNHAHPSTQTSAPLSDTTSPPGHSAESVTLVNRRSVMSALSSAAALPFLTVTSPSIAAPSVPTSDQEILRIAVEIFELRPQYLAAREASDTADEEFENRVPDYPDDLIWGMMCPVRYGHEEVSRDGKRYLLSNLDDVRKLPGRTHVRYYLYIGEPGAEPHDAFDDMGDVLPEYAHLYEAPVDEQKQAIADRMVKALNNWERDREALWRELRCEELFEAFDEVSKTIGDLVRQIESLRAYTLPALQAKAAVFAQHLIVWGEESEIDKHNGFRLIESLIHDLGGALPFQGGSVRNFADCEV